MAEQPPEGEKPVLSFEAFTHRNPVPKYNNLILYFCTTGDGPSYRKAAHFQRFREEHPDLERRLREGIMTPAPHLFTSERTKPFDAELYQAYKIMRSYGATDGDLFG